MEAAAAEELEPVLDTSGQALAVRDSQRPLREKCVSTTNITGHDEMSTSLSQSS